MKIAVLVGSIRADSWNEKFAKAVEAQLPEGVSFEYTNINLPLYNTDLEAEFPTEAIELKKIVSGADGVFVVTPEYNRSMPGVLKNALDWASRPWGDNSFDGKPAVVAGVSISPLGATQAQADLKKVLVYLNTKLMGQPEAYLQSSRIFTEEGSVAEESKEFVKSFAEALVNHVKSN